MQLLAGLIIGVNMGFLLAACFSAAKRADKDN